MKKTLLLITIGVITLLTGCDTTDYETQITNLQEDIQALELQLSEQNLYDDSTIKSDVSDLQSQVSTLLNDVASLSSNINDMTFDQDMADLEVIIEAVQELISNTEVYDDSLVQADILDLQTQLTTILDELSILSDQASPLPEQVLTLSSQVASLLDLVTVLNEEIESLSSLEDFKSYIAPEFSNIPGNQVIEYETNLNLLSLGITASDNFDGDLTSSITVNINNTSILDMGNHAVIYSVTDSDGNTETLVINLEVVVTESLFSYQLINNRTEIEITGFRSVSAQNVSIPAFIGGLPVTSIGDYAFSDNGLITLSLPNTLEEIGEYAFIDNDITTLLLDDTSLHTINNFAFANNSITSILIPNGVTFVGHSVFRNNAITDIFISATVNIIGNDTFTGNVITSIYIFGDDDRFDSVWEAIGLPIELMGTQ